MTTEQLLRAYREYAASWSTWEESFDITNIFDRPEAPQQSTEALAGEVIHKRGGLTAALVEAQFGIEDPDCPEWRKVAYQLIIEASR